MEISVRYEEQTALVSLGGDVEYDEAELLKTELLKILDSQATEVICDLKNLRFISSSGIGRLLFFHKALAERGGRLRLVNLNREIFTLLSVIHMDNIFDIQP